MWLVVSVASAASPVEVPPPNRLGAWTDTLSTPGGGDHVGMIVVGRDEGPIRVDVWDGTTWVRATETKQVADTHVLMARLGTPVGQVRLRSPDEARIRSLDWDLFTPAPERRGPPRGEKKASLPAELTAIGVVSRSAWGADATTCTSLEDDWYRMAIHHTAGSQTYGGTVTGAVQVLQSYAMSSGEYCDIPYQFLVGYDGTLYEGRPYGYYSGATGGDNNDGNIAVCFLGCYHPSDCPNGAGDAVTEAMMDGGQLLVQTLATLHAVPSDSDAIRGHRDWPDNATACPGDWLYARLDDLREPLGPDFAATSSSSSFGASITLRVGESTTGTFELLNVGRETWQPGSTNLGTLPRDAESSLYDPSWLSSTRPATVDAATAPGETGRFTFTVRGNTVGEVDATFAPVEEGVTWFADDGGPADGTLGFHVSVLAAEDTAPEPTDSDTHAAPPGSGAAEGPGETTSLSGLAGCGCSTGGEGAAGAGLFVLGTLFVRVRRRR